MADSTMIEAHVSEDTSVTLHRVQVPELPKPTSVLIHVNVASTNPKDWKMPAKILTTIGDCPNSRDDCAGTIAAIGSAVKSLHVGQRVTALHQLGAPAGVFAEYCIVEDFACIPIPDDMPFEGAATMPMSYFVAAVGLFAPNCLNVSEGPWDLRSKNHNDADEPLLVYGASTAVGIMTIKLANICGIHPIICIAGRAKDWVAEELLDTSKGDVVFDYRDGHDVLVKNLQKALNGKKAKYAFDAVTDKGSYLTLAEVLKPNGKIALTLPGKASKELKSAQGGKFKSLYICHAMAGSMWQSLSAKEGAGTSAEAQNGADLGNLGLGEDGPAFAEKMSETLAKLLKEGKIGPRKYEVRQGGLMGLEGALKDLRAGKNSAESYVVRIEDTEGLEKVEDLK